MKDIVENILSNKLIDAQSLLEDKIYEILEDKLTEIKARMALEMFDLDEGNIQKMGRTKLVKIRIRGGKVQRRKKVSGIKGYTMRGGRMIRMSPQERRNRKMAARRSKFKRRAKLGQALRKRKMSLRRRGSLGL
jgi:hypothetical protein